MTNAREYFEHVSTLPRRIEEVNAAIVEGGEGLRPRPRHGGHSGPHDPTAARAIGHMEAVERLEFELESMQAEIAEAHRVCVGVSRAMGDNYGSVLEMYYIDLLTWDEVAAELGAAKRTCIRWRDVACDWVDAVGIPRAKAGQGFAT